MVVVVVHQRIRRDPACGRITCVKKETISPHLRWRVPPGRPDQEAKEPNNLLVGMRCWGRSMVALVMVDPLSCYSRRGHDRATGTVSGTSNRHTHRTTICSNCCSVVGGPSPDHGFGFVFVLFGEDDFSAASGSLARLP